MARSVLIVNPFASRVTPELVAAVAAELRPADTLVAERAGHAAELAEAACADSDRIYVFAGDGGFNEVVNGLRRPIPVGFVPGGASNVFPRALGLPRDPVACARLLAGSQRVRRISLGRVNGRRFTFSAGLGLDAAVVRAVERARRRGARRAGDLVYAWRLVRILAERGGCLAPSMTVEGARRVAFAAVANCDPYSYFGRLPVRVAPEARFELGLDLVAPVRVRALDLPALAYSLLVRPSHTRRVGVVYLHDADEIRIECDAPTPLQADGEDLGDVTAARFEAERGALDVIV